MANEFKVRKGLIVQGSGSTGDNTILDVQGNQGQLFSITDSLEGTLFSVGDISGIPILEVFSNEIVKIGTFGSEGIIVNGSNVTASGDISASGTITGNSIVGTIGTATQGTIDHDSLANFTSNEHFTQGNITTVGTVTSGNVTAILPTSIVSASAQIATEISGAFTSTSSSLASRTTTLEANGVFTATGISGSFTDASSSLASRTTTLEANGVFTATGISGSFTDASSSLASRTTTLEGNGVFTATGISGSFTDASSSLASRTTTLEGNVGQAVNTTSDVQFNHITASGNISSSGTITANAFTGTLTGGVTGDATGLTGTPNITVGNVTATGKVTAQEYHTEFVSASIMYSSGSTKFGDTIDDVHSFTGSINLSGSLTVEENSKIYFDSTDTYIYAGTGGNEDLYIGADDDILLQPDDDLIIYAGGTQYARFFGAEETVRIGGISTAAPTSKLEVEGNISSSGNLIANEITASGNITVGSIKATTLVPSSHIYLGATKYLYLDGGGDTHIRESSDDTIQISTGGTVRMVISDTATSVANIDITDTTDAGDASGDTGALRTEGGASIAKKLYVGTDLSVGGHITASGNISSSGTGDNFFNGNFKFDGDTTISTVGSSDDILINPAAILYLGSANADTVEIGRQSSTVPVKIFAGSSTPTLEAKSGHITASGNISSSGNIKGNNITTAGDITIGDDLNIAGDQLTFTNDAASAYIRGADALFLESDHDNDDSSEKPIYFYQNGAEMAYIATHGLKVNSHITASGNISSSGRVYGTHFGTGNANRNALDLGTDNTMQFRVNDGSRLTLTQTVFRPSTDEAVALGRTAQKWSELVVNHVTASGNISSSGTVTANAFVGDGSSITGVTAEWDGTHTGDAEITGSLTVVGDVKVTTGKSFRMYNTAGTGWGQMMLNEVDDMIELNRGLQPSGDAGVDLGASNQRWDNAYIDDLFVTGEVQGGSLDINGDADISGNLTASGNISSSGTGSFAMVGIGTTSPSEKLHLYGNANADVKLKLENVISQEKMQF